MTGLSEYKAGPIPFRRLADLITRFGLDAALHRTGTADPLRPWAGPPAPAKAVQLKALIYSPVSPAAADGTVSSVEAQALVLLPDAALLPEPSLPMRGDQLLLGDANWHIAAAVKLAGGRDRLIVQLALRQLET